MADFSDEHVGKRVVAQNGTTIGTVSDVRDGDLYVDAGSDADRGVLSQLGWDGPVSQDTHRLPDRYVTDISDETVRLRV